MNISDLLLGNFTHQRQCTFSVEKRSNFFHFESIQFAVLELLCTFGGGGGVLATWTHSIDFLQQLKRLGFVFSEQMKKINVLRKKPFGWELFIWLQILLFNAMTGGFKLLALNLIAITTTTVYFNEVVFHSVLGLTSPMAFPQHSPPSWPVPSIFPTKSLLSHIFFQHFSPTLPGSTFHSITINLQCLNSLYPTQLISPLNMTKPPESYYLFKILNLFCLTHF